MTIRPAQERCSGSSSLLGRGSLAQGRPEGMRTTRIRDVVAARHARSDCRVVLRLQCGGGQGGEQQGRAAGSWLRSCDGDALISRVQKAVLCAQIAPSGGLLGPVVCGHTTHHTTAANHASRCQLLPSCVPPWFSARQCSPGTAPGRSTRARGGRLWPLALPWPPPPPPPPVPALGRPHLQRHHLLQRPHHAAQEARRPPLQQVQRARDGLHGG
jgi:hypothetical protein